MRRRISLLVAATTSAVVLAFVIPLCLLVRSTAAERAVAEADQEARNEAVLVSSLGDRAALADALANAAGRSDAVTTVVLADGTQLPTRDRTSGDSALTGAVLERARSGAAFTQRTDAGTRIVVPVVTARGTDVVHTWLPAAAMYGGVVQAWLLIALLGALLLAVALVVADQLGRRVSTPVIRVARVADRLREGDLEARAEPEGPPETQALATALNRLAARVEELLVAERAAVGDLSHRLRTPVTALRIDVDRVQDPGLAERLRQHVGVLQRSVDAIVNDARRPVRHDMAGACDAAVVVRTGVDFWSPLAEDQQRPLLVELATGPVPVALDAVDLRDVLDIVVDNVFAHTPEGTPFVVRLLAEDTAEHSPDAVLEVVDGPRAPVDSPSTHDRPGGPTLEAGPGTGTGLGLQIARRTVTRCGGELQVLELAQGWQVRIRLPRGVRA